MGAHTAGWGRDSESFLGLEVPMGREHGMRRLSRWWGAGDTPRDLGPAPAQDSSSRPPDHNASSQTCLLKVSGSPAPEAPLAPSFGPPWPVCKAFHPLHPIPPAALCRPPRTAWRLRLATPSSSPLFPPQLQSFHLLQADAWAASSRKPAIMHALIQVSPANKSPLTSHSHHSPAPVLPVFPLQGQQRSPRLALQAPKTS